MQNSEQQTAVAAADATHDAVDHEYRDASPLGIAMVGLSVVVILIITYLVVWGLFNFFEARQAAADPPPPPLATTPQPPPEPRLLVNPPQERSAIQGPQQEQLNSYGWVDAGTDTVHIPIDRAMEQLAQEGLPVYQGETPAQPSASDDAHGLESEGGQPADATAEPAP